MVHTVRVLLHGTYSSSTMTWYLQFEYYGMVLTAWVLWHGTYSLGTMVLKA